MVDMVDTDIQPMARRGTAQVTRMAMAIPGIMMGIGATITAGMVIMIGHTKADSMVDMLISPAAATVADSPTAAATMAVMLSRTQADMTTAIIMAS